MNQTRDLAAYRVALAFTFVYSGLIVAAWASGSSSLQYPRQMLSLAVLSGLVVNIGFPAFVTAVKNQLDRPTILKRAAPLIVGCAVMSWAVIYYSVTYLFQNGLPGWAAWLVGIIISGMVTMLASFVVIGSPKKANSEKVSDYIGALREGETWLGGARILPAQKGQVVYPGQLDIGGIPLDWDSEVLNILMCGAVGTGKSQIGHGFLRAINQRKNARAIIVDFNGEYYRRHKKPGDVLYNPFDSRSVSGSPFAEMRNASDAALVAASYVPLIDGPNKDWSEYGRDLLTDVLRAMFENGEKNPQKLYRLLTGTPEDLFAYLKEAGLEGWTSPHTMKMSTGARNGIKPYIKIFEKMKPDGDFSVRDWVKNGDGGEGNLYITYRRIDREKMKQFLSATVDMALTEAANLSSCEGLPPEQHRRLFFLLDELHSIGNIPTLLESFATLRKYGVSIVVGIQTLAQWRLLYGNDASIAMRGNISTRAILTQEDGETAAEMEKTLGKQDIERRNFTTAQATGSSRPHWFSAGGSNTSTGRTVNEQIHIERDIPVITAARLQGMPRHEGILMRGGSVHHPFKLKRIDMPEVAPPFVGIEE
jgi:hypothetical protein